jgi:DNA (cytosine-5)-methyltransferase 1
MSESGWLTRSLEQKVPYDRNYTGAIKPQTLKEAFLETMNDIEECGDEVVRQMLDYLLQSLIILRDSKFVALAKPKNLSIDGIVRLLDLHFHSHYKSFGASRLPVLAIYAIYQSLFVDGFKRFENKRLLALEKHTSADLRSGRIGDIDIVNEDNSPFEAVEVKFDIPITHNIVVIAKEKIQPSSVQRYYILSTSEIAANERKKIEEDIQQIKNTHGCQLIVNGIIPTLKYYLRLLDNTSVFIDNYTYLLCEDSTVKYEHKQRWNDLVSNTIFTII